MAWYRRRTNVSRRFKRRRAAPFRRRRTFRRRTPLQRLIKKEVLKTAEAKSIQFGAENQYLYAYAGTGVEQELTQLIAPGTDATDRVGRHVVLTGIKLKYVVNANAGRGPLHFRWFIAKHIGKKEGTDKFFLDDTDVEANASALSGVKGIFAKINHRAWKVLMSGRKNFLTNQYAYAGAYVNANGQYLEGVPLNQEKTGGIMTTFKSHYKKMNMNLTYSAPEAGALAAYQPIRLFFMVRRLNNDGQFTDWSAWSAAEVHYNIELYFRDP